MLAQRQARHGGSPPPPRAPSVIGVQRDRRLVDLRHGSRLALVGGREQRQRLVAQRLDRPQRLAPGEPQRGRKASASARRVERRHAARRRAARAPRRRRRACRRAPRRSRRASALARPRDHAQAEPHGEASVAGRLQRAVPARGVDVDRPHLDAVLAGVAHDLRRRVEAHRLGVEQGGAEHVRVVALHPGRGIGDQREGGGVALRESRRSRSPRAGVKVRSAKSGS